MPATKQIDQKQRIRREAARLFAENGYDATGVQELCEAVGLGRGALYHHIGSKELLLFDIITESVIRVVGEAEHARHMPLAPEAKVRELSRITMAAVSGNLAEWTVFFRELDTLRGERRREALAWRRHFEEVWMAVIEEGVQAGVFRELDPIAIKGILGMHNYAYVWLKPRGRLAPERISEQFCDLLLSGMLASASEG